MWNEMLVNMLLYIFIIECMLFGSIYLIITALSNLYLLAVIISALILINTERRNLKILISTFTMIIFYITTYFLINKIDILNNYKPFFIQIDIYTIIFILSFQAFLTSVILFIVFLCEKKPNNIELLEEKEQIEDTERIETIIIKETEKDYKKRR